MKLLELPAVTVPRSWPQIVKSSLLTVSRRRHDWRLPENVSRGTNVEILDLAVAGAEISKEAVDNTTVQEA